MYMNLTSNKIGKCESVREKENKKDNECKEDSAENQEI